MISVEDARAIMLAHARATPAEFVDLERALGRTLAAPVEATRPQPPLPVSAMDGYAVRSADTPGALVVAGDSLAGCAFGGAVEPRACVRIFTGAPLPDGTDAVVVQEEARREGDVAHVGATPVGHFVRPAGMDFRAGAILLAPPALMTPAAIALAASAGAARVAVRRTPRIAVLCCGDELVSPGDAPAPEQIFDSAGFGVAAWAETWGAAAARRPPLRDDPDAIAQAIDAALDEADIAVFVGGASVGERDHARAAAHSVGARIHFDKVALRPGKPSWFATRGAKMIVGAPGNPASAMVCARLFLRPLIEAMLGRDPDASVAPARARLAAAAPANGPRESYLRARLWTDAGGQLFAQPCGDQDSSLVTVFAAADGLIVRPANAEAIAANALVDTLRL
ncbi:MAG TPA: gephyrin-like molybdotransferase Glp [Caulobacterales bacterium]|nr:gephyrin-like molybdotransferase Glp [Caulobacterales bacterium]